MAKSRFELTKVNVKIVEGSAIDNIKSLVMSLENS